ncbi:hypothetical protein MPTK1_7g16540 [Marchantia polymorpha subsp. ruderalis]|uniref:LysM domain-containing protein n=2 Tax=Marchantia polymorpha TaxID=3197 RepID=A0AAF6C0E2_MARPO|nr:hypothetical protein MARPO_0123s0036 [Marchantia polymorpha]BBN17726.1 hypothetical protein Mp_7g16540 [Marchantia polymorpha subsp. ruderalis]|eukprot:PTQ30549.1 hypothetical protein MARPO_0123s0036 [Marchantia polymorpha]
MEARAKRTPEIVVVFSETTWMALAKILAVFLLLNCQLNNCLADVSRGHQKLWRSNDDIDRMTLNSASHGRSGIEEARKYFTRNQQTADDVLGLAYSHSSSLSITRDYSDLVQRRSLAGSSPTPRPAPAPDPRASPPPNLYSCGVCGENYNALIGDTPLSVAVFCNVTLEELMSLNPGLEDSNNSITDQVIVIPCTDTAESHCTKCGDSVIIESGDTIYLISSSCNIPRLHVQIANPGIDYSNIFPGQYITIPCENGMITKNVTRCGVCGIGFKVETDGNIIDVASRCNVSVSDLLVSNPSVNSLGAIIKGQSLRIPCSGLSSANCGPCGNNFTVKPINIDNVGAISAICRVGFIALTDANPNIDLYNNLTTDMQINIPCDFNQPPVVCSLCSPLFSSPVPVEISTIASICNVSTEVIAYANNLPLSGIIPSPLNLTIPCAEPPARNLQNCGNCGSSFTLQSQVTLDQIAGACATTTAAIRGENGNFTFRLLGPKDVVALPCNMPAIGCGPCGNGYTVVQGDTPSSVAVKCATPIGQILKANANYNFSYGMVKDQILHLPCGSSSSSHLLRRPLRIANQVLRILILLTMLNITTWFDL